MRTRIPRNFFFYWSGQDFLFSYLMAVRSLLKTNPAARCEVYFREEPVHNPHWEVLKDLAGLRVVKADFPALFRRAGVDFEDAESCLNGNIQENQRSDIFRYLVLACYGGVYVDFDAVILKDFGPLLETDFFIGYQQYSGKVILNGGIIGSVADSPALRLCLLELKARLKKPETLSWIGLGPELLSRVLILRRIGVGLVLKILDAAAKRAWPPGISKCLIQWLKKPGLTYELYPAHYFYPFPWNRWEEIFKAQPLETEAYVLHYWGSRSHDIIRNIDERYIRESPCLFAFLLRKVLGEDFFSEDGVRPEMKVQINA